MEISFGDYILLVYNWIEALFVLTIPACERLQDDTHNIQFVVIQGKQTINVLNNL